MNVTVSAAVAGKTPEIVGYNSGHFMPGSNTADWWRYSGVNGARVWPTPTVVEGNRRPRAAGATASLRKPRSSLGAHRLRANPLSTTYINWPYFEEPLPEQSDHRRQHHQPQVRVRPAARPGHRSAGRDQLHEQQLSLGPRPAPRRAGPIAGSSGSTSTPRRSTWPRTSTSIASRCTTSRTATTFRQREWLERLRFASDAVQAAVADVNALYGKSLDAADAGAGDRRQSDVTYYPTWGAPVMQNLHTTLFDGIDPNFKLIDTYAYQQYNLTGESFGSELANVKNSVNAAAGGTPMRFAITEFNVHTAGNSTT